MNSGDEELGYSRRQIADSVSVATRRGQPEDGGGRKILFSPAVFCAAPRLLDR